ncbi:MAG: restriction endonuclease subunit S [Pirellulales bacterium]
MSTDVSYGYTESATDENVGPHFLRITDIQNGIVDWQTVPHCPISKTELEKYRLERGDIVVANRQQHRRELLFRFGPGSSIRLLPDSLQSLAYNSSCALRMVFDACARWWEFINGSKTGSAQAGANAKVLGRFPLRLPPLAQQHAIAHILGTLDDKIELNRRMNETLEAMARAIFKSWFVDFDPVRAKMDGRQPAGMDEATARLFPDSFEHSDAGLVPTGWEVRPLESEIGFQGGYAFKSKDWQSFGVPVVKIGSVKPGIIDLSQVSYVSDSIAQQASRYCLTMADLLIGMTGYVGEVGIVPPATVEPLLNQRVGRFILPSRGTEAQHFGTASLAVTSSDHLWKAGLMGRLRRT